MIGKNDGGPAFPVEVTQDADGNYVGVQTSPIAGWCTGMSIRDWFAGMALSGLLSNSESSQKAAVMFAADAYRVADAMLFERSKTDSAP